MPDRYVVRERVRIYYESKRLATGLTDVKIDIVKTDGNKEIDQAAMSELSASNAPGIYYYDWVPLNDGTYLCYIDSLSDDYKRTMTSQLDIVGRSSKYTKVMGVHGGMSGRSVNRVSVRDTWTEEDKKKLLETLEKLISEQKEINNKISTFEEELSRNSKKLSEFEEKDEFAVNSIKNMELVSYQQLSSKLNEVSNEVTNLLARQVITNNSHSNSISSLQKEVSSLNSEMIKKLSETIENNKYGSELISDSLINKNKEIDEKISRLSESLDLFFLQHIDKIEFKEEKDNCKEIQLK